ncbi:glycoside hydrolase family 3 N-terminal domain-containing protein [Actomonas aquatica]|uniref:Glycoside hydrolase family 3 N-terminal domain-containing protein n=1 Tax=Actomonas aquatica TaxID=2866162 RepID=A0ABZ1C5G6_9BACT|nr:glycoside hydrolase family 3 N-terminal domain-containing protein [Opitutus sp. WL0086]WRQ86731.1 glycoside hydrolase family 3 N-terminal domain-containing protein [Opitutus sp. WL0086]
MHPQPLARRLALAACCLSPALALAAPPPADIFAIETSPAPIYYEGWIDFNKNGQRDPYEDPTFAEDARIADLLARMTLDEKTAQMTTLYGFSRVLKDELPTPAWKDRLWKDGIGNIDEHINGNEGWTQNLPDPDNDLPWSRHTRALNTVQRWFIEETRLGIPVDFTNEGIRGLMHSGATSFPAELGVASTWNPTLAREIGRVTGTEARALGYTNVYSPVLDVARDPRWGRIIESYGEDPFLIGELGLQQVLGIQEQGVASTLKHYAIYGIPKGGRDGHARTDPHATWNEVQTMYLAPFRKAITQGGALGVMASYNDYDGVPVQSSHLFLTEILRDEWGFEGYVVSDSAAVEFIHQKHRVAPTPAEAIRLSVEAGLNIRTNFTQPEDYAEPLRQLVHDGELGMDVIDARVADILRVKFRLGLFDAPYVTDPAHTDDVVRSADHLDVAAQAGRESIILLKNEGNLLPLEGTYDRVLVTGPMADDKRAWWSRYGAQRTPFVTPLEALREAFAGTTTQLDYVKGVDAADANWPESDVYKEPASADVQAGIDAAVAAAREADVIIACLGETDAQCRESLSRISLNLPGYQQELLMALQATGKPVVLVLSNGRPLSTQFAVRHIPAIVEMWFPGQDGGHALTDVLLGHYNPAGRLPVTVPQSVGQIPYNFPTKPGAQDKDYGQVEGPLFAFGHGLSYTTFAYSDLSATPTTGTIDGDVTVSVTVTNTGDRAGDEVVQLYLRDNYSSLTTYERRLAGFQRLHFAPGESRTVTFTLTREHLQLYNADRQWVVEPGGFTVMVGASSADIRASTTFTLTDADGNAPTEIPFNGVTNDPI